MKSSASLLLGSLLSFFLIAGCGGSVESTGTSGGPATSPTGTGTGTPPPTSGIAPMPEPVPAANQGNWSTSASGCANFTVYATHTSGKKFLVVTANKSELGIAELGDTVTIDLASKGGGATTVVAIDTFARAPSEATYCSDIIVDPQTPARSTAFKGTATFKISSLGREGDSYAVTVTLHGVVLRDADGTLQTLPDLTYSNVGVGWLPG